MKRLFRFLVIHLGFRDRCPICYGLGIDENGWSTVPNCPECKGTGFLCWQCGKPMHVICGKQFFRYYCKHCPAEDKARFE